MNEKKKIKNIQSVYIPDEKLPIMEELDVIRWREHKSMSDMMIEAAKEYVERHKEGNNQMRLDSDELAAIPQFHAHVDKIRTHLNKRLDNEKDEYKFKIQEWNGIFKERFGESAV